MSLASRYETCEVKNEKQKCVLVENISRSHALFSLFSFPVQMGTNKCASQAGMNAYGTRRHLYDPKANVLPPMDSSTIGLQMGTNKGASQVCTFPYIQCNLKTLQALHKSTNQCGLVVYTEPG